ncbi:MAG: hypothetical protein LBG45_09970 [Dysgonamonadaceae bacterium]|jgi:hypothetical protein|nr:hypothetical protein [Dysgonamonadaceae bacterium]
MLKQLYSLLSGLILAPDKTWRTLTGKRELNNEDFYKSYLYPVVGIIALMSFIGVWTEAKDFQLQIALKIVIKETVTYFGGFYLAAYGLFRLSGKHFGLSSDFQHLERFVGYSSSAIYVVPCINVLFQSMVFYQIFILYTVYIVWHGSKIYIPVTENYLTKFTVFSSAIIILSPVVVRIIIALIMPGL